MAEGRGHKGLQIEGRIMANGRFLCLRKNIGKFKGQPGLGQGEEI